MYFKDVYQNFKEIFMYRVHLKHEISVYTLEKNSKMSCCQLVITLLNLRNLKFRPKYLIMY